MTDEEVRSLWLTISDLSLEVAGVRDAFLALPAEELRFMQLEDLRGLLLDLETKLFEYLEIKAPLFGSKPSSSIFACAGAAIGSARIALTFAKDDLALKTVSPDGKGTLDQNIIGLQMQLNRDVLSDETRRRAERSLEMARGAKKSEFRKLYELGLEGK